jgi:hypothetical protein
MLQRQASAIDPTPTNRTSLPNISRISIVRKALREIIKLVDFMTSELDKAYLNQKKPF